MKNVAARIETIVSSALLSEPMAIKVKAKPNPAAAPKARSIGFNGSPCDNSGPLAQKLQLKQLLLQLKLLEKAHRL